MPQLNFEHPTDLASLEVIEIRYEDSPETSLPHVQNIPKAIHIRENSLIARQEAFLSMHNF